MTQITHHTLPVNDARPQSLWVSKSGKFVKAVMNPKAHGEIVIIHEITQRADHVQWDYLIVNGTDILPEGYERLDSIVTNSGSILHVMRKIPVDVESAPKVEIGLDGVEHAAQDPEPTTETTFHFEASDTSGFGASVKITGECKFDGIFLLLERFSDASPGEKSRFVKKLINDFEAKQMGGGHSLEMFTAEKWVKVKAKRDADWADFQRRTGQGYAVG